MVRLVLCAVAPVALLSAGCVPVLEPVGDVNKAAPNEKLLGTWKPASGTETWVVDRPEVRGNPKGLMRVRTFAGKEQLDKGAPQETLWFFTVTLGGQTYVNAPVHRDKVGLAFANFEEEGAYLKWVKSDKCGYFVGHLVITGDGVTLHGGDKTAFGELMAKEKFAATDDYYNPGAWLAGHLEKKGPGDIFAGPNKYEFARVKK